MLNIMCYWGNADGAAMQYHHTPIITAKIPNTENTKGSRGFRTTGTLIRCWWECKLVRHSGRSWQFLVELNIDLPHDPAITPSGIHPSELKTHFHKNLHANVHGSFVHNC